MVAVSDAWRYRVVMPAQRIETVAARLRTAIMRGRLSPGDTLPSRRVLQAELGAGSATVQRAVDELVADGFLVAEARQATFVAKHPPHLFRYGLVLPELPGSAGHDNRFWQALVAAARLPPIPGAWFTIHYGIDGDGQRAEHRALLDSCRRRAFAGLVMMKLWLVRPWFEPERVGIPVVVNGPGASVAGTANLALDLRRFHQRALDYIASRGLTRVAVVVAHDQAVDFHVDALLAHAQHKSLFVPSWRVAGVPLDRPAWARSLVHGFFNPGQAEPPQALIVADDHLVGEATRGLLDAGVSAERMPLVIAHANFPHPPVADVPCVYLGWDARDYLRTAVEMMERMRQGAAPTDTVTLEPRFTWEIPPAAAEADFDGR